MSAPTDRSRFPFNATEMFLLFVLAAIQFTHILDFMLLMPLKSRLTEALGIDATAFSQIVAAYAFAACASGLLVANWMDRYDRKHTLLALYLGLVAGTAFCALATGYWTLLAARVVAGAFGGVLGGITLAIVGDVFPDHKRATAMGVVIGAFSVASAVGVPFGLYFANRGDWRTPFAVLAGVSGLVLIGAAFALPPLRGHLGRRAGGWQAYGVLLANPSHQRALLFSFLLVLATATIVPFIAAYMEYNVGLGRDWQPWIYAVGGVATFISMPVVGRVADLYGKRATFTVFMLLLPIPVLAITHLGRVGPAGGIVATALFMVITSGRMVPAMAMVTGSTVAATRGTFMSVNAAVQQFAFGAAAILAGRIVNDNAPDHHLEHFGVVGWVAVGVSLLTLLLAPLVKPAAGGQRSVEPELAAEPAVA